MQHNVAHFWGRKAYRTGETNPFHPDAPEHRQFVQGRMDARALAAAHAKMTLAS